MSSFLFSAIFFGVSASLLQISGYIFYLTKIKLGRVRPNTASWSIWAFGSILETVSYIWVTGDWVKNLLPIVCSISAVILFFYCLTRGHFGKISRLEWILIVMDCVAIFLWWWYHSATYANLFLMFTAIVSFVPIILHVWKDQMTEDATPWYLWTTAYFFLTVVVFLRWEKWEDLVYPITFMILHIMIAVLALDNRVPKTLRFVRIPRKMY